MFFNIKNSAVIIISVGFFLLDRFLKQLALKGVFLELIPGWLAFNLSFNSGIAFSWPAPRLLVIFLSICALIFLSFEAWKNRADSIFFIGLNLIIWGAFSNLLDRLAILSVIDYFDVAFFSIFNLADIMIVVGCLIILGLKVSSRLWYNKKNEYKKDEID